MPHLNDLTHLFPSQFQNSFDENELAFLALTHKVEGELRDKIAWLLNQNIGKNSLIIREWNRHDLVIMNNSTQQLESIIEFKNQLGFEIRTPGDKNKYLKDLRNDLLKSARSIQQKKEGDMGNSEIFFVMFGRTLDNTPNHNNPNIQQAVNYWRGAIADCNRLLTQPIIYQEQFDVFEKDWNNLLNIAQIPTASRRWMAPVAGGTFLGIGIKIITSIIGPFGAQDIFNLNTDFWHLP